MTETEVEVAVGGLGGGYVTRAGREVHHPSLDDGSSLTVVMVSPFLAERRHYYAGGTGDGRRPDDHDHLSKAVRKMRCGNYGKRGKIGCMRRIGYL
jgi:hypothetical protein